MSDAKLSAVFRKVVLSLAAVLFAVGASLSAKEPKGIVTYEKGENGIFTFFVDGEFFAQYRPEADPAPKEGEVTGSYDSHGIAGTPIVWPICSAAGTLMTRGFPMDERNVPEAENDAFFKNLLENSRLGSLTANKDHIHHRSLWFNHGDVNGVDFWGPDRGQILQQGVFSITEEAHTVAVKVFTAWVPQPNETPLCVDTRTITFGVIPARPEIRYIDFDVKLSAYIDEVTLADTKEGTFGYRTPGSMDVDAKGRSEKWGGHILSSEGDKDEAAWGKRASWVDYYGPVPKRLSDTELASLDRGDPAEIPLTEAGVDIMNHPAGFRYPSWYHVRTYGLFAVNPFGIKDFEPQARLDGSVVLKKDESLSFHYRVLIHDDPLSFDELQSLFDEYKNVSKD
ncbi:MAG: PmoA family protein [Thermoguttaceae bacterium]|nr:PmoA family protein [Thermoguttaceae bacterium]